MVIALYVFGGDGLADAYTVLSVLFSVEAFIRLVLTISNRQRYR